MWTAAVTGWDNDNVTGAQLSVLAGRGPTHYALQHRYSSCKSAAAFDSVDSHELCSLINVRPIHSKCSELSSTKTVHRAA